MFAAALIVLRETLEAALLIGIVAAATRALPGRTRWLAAGLLAGLAGSIAVAAGAERVSTWFDGAGQEIFNAAALGVAIAMLGWHVIWMRVHARELAGQARSLAAAVGEGQRELSALALVVALTVLREGSETVLFLYSSATAGDWFGIASGGAIGLAGGVLIGVGLYAGLLRIPLRWFFTATNALVLLLAAGMASQMARFLVQADLLPSLATPLWNTSNWLAMDSLPGRVLQVIAGYDANPSGMQVVFYTSTLVILLGAMAHARTSPTTAPASHP